MAAPNNGTVAALNNRPVPQNLSFPPIPWWYVLPANQQETAAISYRQPYYHPATMNFTHNTVQVFDNMIMQTYGPNNDVSRVFMWARLLTYARTTTLTILKRLADTRNVLAFENAAPSQKLLELNPFDTPRWEHRRLCDMFEMFFHDHQLEVNEPGFIVSRQDQVQHVVQEGNRYKEFRRKLRTVPEESETNERAKLEQQQGGLRPRFAWLDNFVASLDDGLRGMNAANNWSSLVTDAGPPRSLAHAMAAADGMIPEMTRLLAFLLERDGSFNATMAQEHIFGCLTDKRIALLSPTQLGRLHDILNKLPTFDAWANSLNAVPRLWHPGNNLDPVNASIYGRLDQLYNEISLYQRRMRHHFQYRQLVDWGYKPLWNKIFVTVHPDLGISDATIDEFLAWTTNDHLTSNIFGVHPVKAGRFGDEEQCLICLEGLEEADHISGRLIAELKCGHFYHPECVLGFFDRQNYWDNRCPSCRQPAGSMKDMIAPFPSEAKDRDYDGDKAPSLTDAFLRDSVIPMMTDYGTLSNAIGEEYAKAYWDPITWSHLSWRRAQREARRAGDDIRLYGV